MLPVTPKRTTIGTGHGTYYLDSVGYVQKLPRNLDLELERREGSVRSRGATPTAKTPAYIASRAFDYAFEGRPRTDNKAYSRLIGKIHGADADLGVTLGEHKSARQIITDRSKQLLDLARALKRRDLGAALRVVRRPGGTSKPTGIRNDLASSWLEWSWGWRPMIEDIGNALETLVSPVPDHRVRAASMEDFRQDVQIERYTGPAYGGTLNRDIRVTEEGIYKVSMWMKVRTSNPNLALANRLGLVNPVGIYWAVLPFSFVVDKFVNVGQVINSLTDLYGFEVSNAWISRSCWLLQSQYERDVTTGPTGNIVDSREVIASLIGKGRRRKPGIYKPTLTAREASIGSFSEAVSYFSLLIVLLNGAKKAP